MRALSRSVPVSLLLAMAVVGCGGSRQDVVRSYQAGGGTVREYDATMLEAWDAARAALQWNHASSIEEHLDEGWMFGIARASFWTSYGAAMGIWLEPINDQGTRVRAVVSRRLVTNVTAPSEGGLLNDIGKAIALEKQGRELTDQRPK